MEKAKKIPYYGGLALLIYMPFHIFLSQWLSTFTGGLDAWKVGKDVMTMILVLISVGLVRYTGVYKKSRFYTSVFLLAAAYLGLHILLYFTQKETSQDVAALAAVYNNRLLWYLLIGMSAALLTPKLVSPAKLGKLLIAVSTAVCLFGLVQHLLPNDVMTHFGYSVKRGVKPAFFIDDKADLPRVMGPLRDPNSLGAFLALPIAFLIQALLTVRQKEKRTLLMGLLGLHGLILLLTFSRGGWIATAICVTVAVWLQHKSKFKKWLRQFWLPILVVTCLLFVGGFLMRDQYFIQNVIFHSDESTQAELDSNELHFEAARTGLEQAVERPLGYGPGTAGIVSIQNGSKSFLTENYFIQILHEVGVIGVGIFIAVLFMAFRTLSASSKLSRGLIGAFFGLLFASLISHLWTNEAVAAEWWLLTGFLVVAQTRNSHNKRAV